MWAQSTLLPIKYLIIHIIRGSNPHNNKNNVLFYFKRQSDPRNSLTLYPIKYLIIYECEGQTHTTFKINFLIL